MTKKHASKQPIDGCNTELLTALPRSRAMRPTGI
jgi:hypothetical protein